MDSVDGEITNTVVLQKKETQHSLSDTKIYNTQLQYQII